MKHTLQGFPNSGKGWGDPKFYWGGGIFLLGKGTLRRSDFDDSNLFPS